MKSLLQISINTLKWTEGNHVWFDAKLKPGASIEVHWGDGTHSTLRHYHGYSMSRVAHYYKSTERKELPFEIEFLSEDSDSLLELVDGTWETRVNNVVFKDCPALTYLQYTQLHKVDFSGCPNLETLVVTEYYADKLELSAMPLLKKVICRMSEKLTSLDLTQNNDIEELDMSHCRNLRKISVSNSSQLRVVVNDYTELDSHSLKWLQATVERNGGQIQDEWLDTDSISRGCFGEEL
ncbi:MAG: hypothetical protein K2M04_04210 [Muribaculaceae bacterium]|nr:hypothetical protein [Muribaculaceae bacterium]